MKIRKAGLGLGGLLLTALSMSLWLFSAQSSAQGQTFKVRSNVVPLDVSVLDTDGNPVLDLKRDDFEVFENGRLQAIAYFSAPPSTRTKLVSPETEPARPASEVSAPPSGPVTVFPRRFLILLGNIGKDEFHSVEAAADFVRGLEPDDEVSLMAFRRVGEFTRDHEKTATAIREYNRVNAVINSNLTLRRRSDLFLQVSPPSKILPSAVRERIKSFYEESGLGSRELSQPVFDNVTVNDLTSSSFDSIRQTDSRNAIAGAQIQGPDSRLAGGVDLFVSPENFALNPFDEARRKLLSDFPVGTASAREDISRLDLSQIVTAIEYLSFLEGEKYLFFFNNQGLHAVTEQLDQIAQFAANSRVRLFLFQTGGVEDVVSFGPNRGQLIPEPRRFSGAAVLGNIGVNQGLAPVLSLAALETLARVTGGAASIHGDVGKGLARALRMADFKYELAYATADENWDEKFRKIEVRVKREGVQVFHRGGYAGAPAPTEEERRRNLTLLRTVAAMKQTDNLKEIPLEMKVAFEAEGEESNQYKVRFRADLTERSFRQVGATHQSELTVVYFLIQGRKVVSVEDSVTLELSQTDYQDALSGGFNFVRDLYVPQPFSKGLLKLVVYEPANDLLGSIGISLQGVPTS